MRTVLLISAADIKERTGLHNNVDEKLIHPEIMTAQDMYILPALGSALYNRLQQGVEDDDLGEDEDKLIDEYIVPTLVYYVLSELPMGLSYQFYNKGLVRKTDNGTQEPSAQEILDVANRYRSRADYYRQRMIKYLKAEAFNNTFPEYKDTSGRDDDIYPSNEGYSPSVWLGE